MVPPCIFVIFISKLYRSDIHKLRDSACLVAQVGGDGHVRCVGSAHAQHVLWRVLRHKRGIQHLPRGHQRVCHAHAKQGSPESDTQQLAAVPALDLPIRLEDTLLLFNPFRPDLGYSTKGQGFWG